ncbi:MAG: hypothetical protein K5880_04565 [Hydrogenophaga sp.]|jgi:hypothetical protein|uniref:hypothetical protein n=1 Tax=Hydrogenophaga sp. TaxID=1904254 RepID=UPI00260C7C9A|nr:hypothetical protein [Hydrogenophaga sp.]MCV0437878.1 hypothetical protein [Hydrogenophaga sp.]
MSRSHAPARSSLPCCATVIRTRGTSPVARLTRWFDELMDRLVAWRCRRHEAWLRRGWPKLPF